MIPWLFRSPCMLAYTHRRSCRFFTSVSTMVVSCTEMVESVRVDAVALSAVTSFAMVHCPKRGRIARRNAPLLATSSSKWFPMVLNNTLATCSATLASRVAGSASLLSKIYLAKTSWSRKIGRPRHLTGRMQSIGFGRLCRSAQLFAYSDGDGLLSKVALMSMGANS